MTPTDFAAVELANWEHALCEQRAAERQLKAARRRRRAEMYKLLSQVDVLQLRSDLLLAEAVKVKCSFAAQKLRTKSANTTVPGLLLRGEDA